MVNRITTVDAVRQIDTILHHPNKKMKLEDEYATIQTVKSTVDEGSSQLSEFSDDQLKDLVEEAKAMMKNVNRQITFKLHEGTGRPLIQLIDSESKKVIREIPPEKMLDVVAGIWKWAGLVIDRKE